MDHKPKSNSTELLSFKPFEKDEKLVVRKRPTGIDDLRKNFQRTPCSVLGQVRSFLPKIAAANEDLRLKIENDPEFSADIEDLNDEQEQHIQMTLALVEQDNSDCSDSSSDESDEDIQFGEVTEDNIKLPNQVKVSKQPLIQTLATDSTESCEKTDNTQCDKGDTENSNSLNT